jgi:hypothetical protein
MIFREGITLRSVLVGLNNSLQALDLGGFIETPFEVFTPMPGFPETDHAARPWMCSDRTVLIVEADRSDPGIFWVNLSRYSMPPDFDPQRGYVRQFTHLATAKVYGRPNAWAIAASASRLLDI